MWVENARMQTDQKDPDEAAKSFENIISLTQGAAEEVRRISMNLRPAILDDFGLLPTISWLCRDFESIYPSVEIKDQVEVQEKDVPESLKIVIYRVMQEALNNISKHSRASLVRLFLIRRKSTLELKINDNGVGFNSVQRFNGESVMPKGLGLASMEDRTTLSGGSFSIESQEGEGTTIQASWECDS